MRIIGGHDYYDTAMAFGADREVVFARTKSSDMKCTLAAPERIYPWEPLDENGRNFNKAGSLILLPLFIYVAGIKYTGVRLVEDGLKNKEHYFWKFNDLVNYLATKGAHLKRSRPQYKSRWRDHSQQISDHFSQSGSTGEREICIENGIVVATLLKKENKWQWRVNGDNLKDFEFYRCLDPYKCYQEIAMYVGGVLPRKGAEMATISDKSKIKKHGMDKWSFRKMGKNSV